MRCHCVCAIASLLVAMSVSTSAAQDTAQMRIGQGMIERGQPDSALAFARAFIASGQDRDAWGRFLLSPAQAFLRKGTTTRAVAEHEKAFAVAAQSDSLAPSPEAKFMKTVAAYFVAQDALQVLNQTSSCPMAARAERMVRAVRESLTEGASVQPGTADKIRDWLVQVGPYTERATVAYCR